MFCLKCGTRCEDSDRFCTHCGEKLVIPFIIQIKKKKKFPFKLCLIGGGLLVGILLLVLIAMNGYKNENGYECYSEKNIEVVYNIANTIEISFISGIGEEIYKTEISTDGSGTVSFVEGDIPNIFYNSNRTIFALIEDNGELVCVTKNGNKTIANDVSSCEVSANGAYIVYVKGEEYISSHKEYSGAMYSYNIEKNKTTKIADDVVSDWYVLSPDGKTIAFIKDYLDDDDYKMCTSVNGEEYSVEGESKIPVGISDDGIYFYYIEGTELYVKTKENRELLTSDMNQTIRFNSDLSEIIFYEDDSINLSIHGSRSESLWEESYTIPCLPRLVTLQYNYRVTTDFSCKYETIIYGIDSFLDQSYILEDGFYYLDEKANEHQICSGFSDFNYFSLDKQCVLYYDGNNLYMQTDLTMGERESKILAKNIDIKNLVADSNLNHIYYVDAEEQLIYVNAKGESKMIADKVLEESLSMDIIDQTVYFIVNGPKATRTLYYSSKGSDIISVKGATWAEITSNWRRVYYRSPKESGMQYYLLLSGSSVLIREER